MHEDEPCGGGVAYDEDGNVLWYYACEVHIFDEGICPWQKRTNEQDWRQRP